MTPQRHFKKRKKLSLLFMTSLVLVSLAGCSSEAKRGYLPGYEDGPVTNMTERITDMWVGSWIAALTIGLITWGLMLWCIVMYRKQRDDNRLPLQTRYHLPLEIMYTLIPIVLIGGLYFFNTKNQTEIRATDGPVDTHIQVIGKQWSWDFNYLDEDVYDTGQHAMNVGELDESLGAPGTDASLPTLYLPVNERVEFTLDSRDVIHSFWIPAFLDKMDMIPHRTNTWQVTPMREGIYAGKCAELCGEFHSGMLFNVKVVSREEYDQHMQDLRNKGQTGELGNEYNRQQQVVEAGTAEEE